MNTTRFNRNKYKAYLYGVIITLVPVINMSSHPVSAKPTEELQEKVSPLKETFQALDSLASVLDQADQKGYLTKRHTNGK